MSSDLLNTWNTIATMWNRWAPPLRPCAEDTAILESSLATWASDGYAPKDGYAQALLLGVTPEIATMHFPTPTNLLAIDKSPNMITYVWPGDIPDQRTAIQGEWLAYPASPKSKNIVLADGSLVFFQPNVIDRLIYNISRMLDKNGIFLTRCFVMPEKKETVTNIFHQIRDGYRMNFHEFKFRVAMATQKSFEEGVTQDAVWRAMQPLINALPFSGFSRNDLETGDLYKNKTARLHFPTVSEMTAILNDRFSTVTVVKPTYQFGQCCQTFIAQAPR